MALEYGTFGYGAAVYPLATGTGNSLLRDADPSLYYALDFIAGVLNIHLGTRLAAECSEAGVDDINTAVAYAVPYDPEPFLTEAQFKFPLLALFRTRDRVSQSTATWTQTESDWTLLYVLPPLSPSAVEQIAPIRRAVVSVLDNRISQGFDPAYQSGFKVWEQAKIVSAELVEASYGGWEGVDDLNFLAVSATLRIRERTTAVAGAFDAMAGVNHQTDVTDATGTTTNVADFKSDVPLGEPEP